MRYLTPAESDEILGFARRAAEHFLANPQHETFTDGEIECGALFGVRWGANRASAHAVLVLRINEGFEPIIVGDLDHDRQVAEKAAAPLPGLGTMWARRTEPWRLLQVVAVSSDAIALEVPGGDARPSIYRPESWPGDLSQFRNPFEPEGKCAG